MTTTIVSLFQYIHSYHNILFRATKDFSDELSIIKVNTTQSVLKKCQPALIVLLIRQRYVNKMWRLAQEKVKVKVACSREMWTPPLTRK